MSQYDDEYLSENASPGGMDRRLSGKSGTSKRSSISIASSYIETGTTKRLSYVLLANDVLPTFSKRPTKSSENDSIISDRVLEHVDIAIETILEEIFNELAVFSDSEDTITPEIPEINIIYDSSKYEPEFELIDDDKEDRKLNMLFVDFLDSSVITASTRISVRDDGEVRSNVLNILSRFRGEISDEFSEENRILPHSYQAEDETVNELYTSNIEDYYQFITPKNYDEYEETVRKSEKMDNENDKINDVDDYGNRVIKKKPITIKGKVNDSKVEIMENVENNDKQNENMEVDNNLRSKEEEIVEEIDNKLDEIEEINEILIIDDDIKTKAKNEEEKDDEEKKMIEYDNKVHEKEEIDGIFNEDIKTVEEKDDVEEKNMTEHDNNVDKNEEIEWTFNDDIKNVEKMDDVEEKKMIEYENNVDENEEIEWIFNDDVKTVEEKDDLEEKKMNEDNKLDEIEEINEIFIIDDDIKTKEENEDIEEKKMIEYDNNVEEKEDDIKTEEENEEKKMVEDNNLGGKEEIDGIVIVDDDIKVVEEEKDDAEDKKMIEDKNLEEREEIDGIIIIDDNVISKEQTESYINKFEEQFEVEEFIIVDDNTMDFNENIDGEEKEVKEDEIDKKQIQSDNYIEFNVNIYEPDNDNEIIIEEKIENAPLLQVTTIDNKYNKKSKGNIKKYKKEEIKTNLELPLKTIPPKIYKSDITINPLIKDIKMKPKLRETAINTDKLNLNQPKIEVYNYTTNILAVNRIFMKPEIENNIKIKKDNSINKKMKININKKQNKKKRPVILSDKIKHDILTKLCMENMENTEKPIKIKCSSKQLPINNIPIQSLLLNEDIYLLKNQYILNINDIIDSLMETIVLKRLGFTNCPDILLIQNAIGLVNQKCDILKSYINRNYPNIKYYLYQMINNKRLTEPVFKLTQMQRVLVFSNDKFNKNVGYQQISSMLLKTLGSYSRLPCTAYLNKQRPQIAPARLKVVSKYHLNECKKNNPNNPYIDKYKINLESLKKHLKK